jgi:hypothetical protein
MMFDEPMMFNDPVFGEPGVMAAVEMYVDPTAAAPLPLALTGLALSEVEDVGSAALLAAGAAHAGPAGGLGLGAAGALLYLPTAAATAALLNLPTAAAATAALLNLPTAAALLAALLLGQSTCCGAGHGNRRSRQSNRYLTYHGALHPSLLSTPAFANQTR